MFLEFFYLLRARGLEVSINEWMTLVEALDKGLAESSLMGFYRLCRSILIKTESDFDKFDQVFAEYFQGIETPEDLPEEFWRWLNESDRERDLEDLGDRKLFAKELDELLKMFEERIKEQKEKHDGENYWIGTGGTSPMGRGGYHPSGIRVGGKSRHKTALQVAGERNFKDFREDTILDIRQFQMAFRKLRQYSSRVDTTEKELDIDKTIDETCATPQSSRKPSSYISCSSVQRSIIRCLQRQPAQLPLMVFLEQGICHAFDIVLPLGEQETAFLRGRLKQLVPVERRVGLDLVALAQRVGV